jgi:type I restriction enzyme S subunit
MSDSGIPLGYALVPRAEKAMPADFSEEPYLGLDDIEAHTTRLLGSKESSTMKSAAKRFYPGDVLYSRLRPYLNKVWLADRSGLCSAEFIILPSSDFVDGAFLKYRLNATDFVSFANSLNAGDRPRVDFDQISSFLLPPFSRSYQKRIVSKIEELFSELDAGEESLRRARRQLGVYRQSLLKQAFEGKLTEQWRKQNPELLESPDQLVQRIQAERQVRYSAELKEWEAVAQGGSKPKKPKDFDPIDAETLSSLRQLPVGWAWVRFGNLLAISSGNGLTAHQMKEGPYPVYGGNGVSGYHDAFMFVESQMVIGRVGAKCGITHITAPKSWVTDNALVCEFQIESISMEFMRLLLNHLDLNKLSVSTAQPVVSGSKLNPLPLPLCSLPEQREIVRLLDEQFTVIEQNEREIDAALKRSAALRQSILKKAFTGQLVPQDPTDEPASVLLERIRKERETASKVKRRAN